MSEERNRQGSKPAQSRWFRSFFISAGIVHALSPLGLLAVSALLAIAGLYTLSLTTGLIIFAAATRYGFGKTFFWPTMLGVVSEQLPKGGALTLNAISGIGMMAVGTLGFPGIGALQAHKENQAVAASHVALEVPSLVADGKLTVLKEKSIYEVIQYQIIDDKALAAKVNALPPPRNAQATTEIAEIRENSRQGALADMAIFPGIMLLGYLLLIGYFQMKGGYKPVELEGGGGGH